MSDEKPVVLKTPEDSVFSFLSEQSASRSEKVSQKTARLMEDPLGFYASLIVRAFEKSEELEKDSRSAFLAFNHLKTALDHAARLSDLMGVRSQASPSLAWLKQAGSPVVVVPRKDEAKRV